VHLPADGGLRQGGGVGAARRPFARIAAALLAALALAGAASAQAPEGPAGEAVAGALPLYETPPPVPCATPGGEQWMGADATALAMRNVTRPTLRPVLPEAGAATGRGVS